MPVISILARIRSRIFSSALVNFAMMFPRIVKLKKKILGVYLSEYRTIFENADVG